MKTLTSILILTSVVTQIAMANGGANRKAHCTGNENQTVVSVDLQFRNNALVSYKLKSWSSILNDKSSGRVDVKSADGSNVGTLFDAKTNAEKGTLTWLDSPNTRPILELSPHGESILLNCKGF